MEGASRGADCGGSPCVMEAVTYGRKKVSVAVKWATKDCLGMGNEESTSLSWVRSLRMTMTTLPASFCPPSPK
jgi:hypothetical protein